MMKKNQTSNKSGNKKQLARRSFLKRLWGVLGLIAGAELIWVGSNFLRPGNMASGDQLKKIVIAGKVSDFKPGEVFPFRNGQFYLVRYKNGGFMAVSLKCSHLGCSVLWNETEQVFNCPCHASSFDKFGQVINPPAPRPLDVYPVIIEEGLVKINTGQPQKRKSFDQSQITFA